MAHPLDGPVPIVIVLKEVVIGSRMHLYLGIGSREPQALDVRPLVGLYLVADERVRSLLQFWIGALIRARA